MLIPKGKKITSEVKILSGKQPFSCFPWPTSYHLQNDSENFPDLNKAQGQSLPGSLQHCRSIISLFKYSLTRNQPNKKPYLDDRNQRNIYVLSTQTST